MLAMNLKWIYIQRSLSQRNNKSRTSIAVIGELKNVREKFRVNCKRMTSQMDAFFLSMMHRSIFFAFQSPICSELKFYYCKYHIYINTHTLVLSLELFWFWFFFSSKKKTKQKWSIPWFSLKIRHDKWVVETEYKHSNPLIPTGIFFEIRNSALLDGNGQITMHSAHARNS